VLHEFIAVNRDEIIRRCRAKVSARSMKPPTDGRIDHGVPVFLDQLTDALRSADRTGVGLGLAFSRWGAEANDGRIYARNLPGEGCVFTVDLPRLPVPAVEVAQA
jgi:hypothetical protein